MCITAICSIRLFVVVIYCYHGNGSYGRHVCTKHHGLYVLLIGCHVALYPEAICRWW